MIGEYGSDVHIRGVEGLESDARLNGGSGNPGPQLKRVMRFKSERVQFARAKYSLQLSLTPESYKHTPADPRAPIHLDPRGSAGARKIIGSLAGKR